MNRLTLERHQVWLYLAAISGGLALGSLRPHIAPALEALLWPSLATLLYTTFVQVPLLHVRDAFGDRRFVLAVLVGNFVLIPLAVWLALPTLPDEPALRLGVLLVLMVPCTDWFITFTQLGRGDGARAIAVTPLNLLLQLLLLPVYLWLMLPSADFGAALNPEEMLPAALSLVGLPLAAAALTERWVEAQAARSVWRERLGWCPVPLLTLVVFLIAATQVGAVRGAGALLLTVLPLFVGFLLMACLLALALSRWLRLRPDAGRTLAFSFGTRNSFVVLPFALALPAGWEATVVVVVFQSLVELFGMVGYLWWLPKLPFGTGTGPHRDSAARG
ncbi:ACR3 family arsenite efflux pump ArsB [Crenobacter luteus]|uniref:arsenic resistance protein n=1 Tax=Crenobacter luteus TaxID=1452487 RepID=UPI001045E0C7|nr:arsenic resistance protein [Crenobacter luteus]TCP12484.1 ACR3 family arsenite efflux pump ArsB [Crenobacter luteus]